MNTFGFMVRTDLGSAGEQTILRAVLLPDDDSKPIEFAWYESYCIVPEDKKEQLHLLFDEFVKASNNLFCKETPAP